MNVEALVRDHTMIGSLITRLSDPAVPKFDFVSKLDVRRAPPSGHEGRARRAAIFVAEDDRVSQPPRITFG